MRKTARTVKDFTIKHSYKFAGFAMAVGAVVMYHHG